MGPREQRTKPDNLDLIAERDCVAVGVATVSKFGGAPDGDLAYTTLRVPREERRQGIGTPSSTARHGTRATSGRRVRGARTRARRSPRARDGADTANHWMTGVARAARGRGIAVALKQAQIAAAKADGWAFLRTQNDLANAAMRAVNEKLGYERRFEWVHLVGPLAPA